MTISEVAARADVPVPTIRYYERRGLIAEPPRSPGGYRQYDETTVKRLRFIRRAQDLGFTLQEVRDLLELRVEDAASCAVVEVKARDKIARVREKMHELQRMETVLASLVQACRTRESTAECPILDALAEEGM